MVMAVNPNENIAENASAAPRLKFLRDEASDTDFFGSHARVATAIADVVEFNPDLKVIGILGPWGSGKSTVVRLIKNQLEKSNTRYLLFTYDAWLHQSDPPRRAFLERLLDFLVAEKRLDPEAWKGPMDRLNRRLEESDVTTTPTLTTAGHLLLLSLVLVPFGTRFLGADWYKRMGETSWGQLDHWVFPTGFVFAAAPLLVAAALFYSWRPTRRPWKGGFFSRANWTTHRHPHEKESLLAVIANKTVHRQSSRVTKTPEPTTIEFQAIFRDMLTQAALNGTRLVLVVDNLDRLPETDAVEMWTTIRSFFLGAIPECHRLDQAAMPTVLLPIDDGAVARIYGKASDSDRPELARSFIDKTFDVTFRVTGPVLSDWSAYLSDKMSQVFGTELAEAWSIDVGRMYESVATGRITPRDLNRLVNGIATLWIQWAPLGVPFPSVAYYAVNRIALEEDLLGELQNAANDLSDHDAKWQQSLAAIHFGVHPDNALQVYLAPELREAIRFGNADAFAQQVAIKGFDRVLLRHISDNRLDHSEIGSLCKLLNAADVDGERWVPLAWRRLRKGFLEADLLGPGPLTSGEIFSLLLKHSGSEEKLALLNAIAKVISDFELSRTASKRVLDQFREIIAKWLEEAQNLAAPVEPITIDSPETYLEIAPVVTYGNRSSSLIIPSMSSDRLVDVYLKLVNEGPATAHLLEQAQAVLAQKPSVASLGMLVNSAHDVLQSQSAGHFATEASAHILGALRATHPFADERAQALADSGAFSARADESLMTADLRVASRLCALAILKEVDLSGPNGQSWTEFLSDHPDFISYIDAYIEEYGNKAFIHTVVSLSLRKRESKELSSAIMLRRLDARKLGNLYTERVVKMVDPYLGLLPEDRHAEFAAQLSNYGDFWKHLTQHGATDSGLKIYSLLIGRDHGSLESRRSARSNLRALLKAVASDVWATEIGSDGPLLQIAVRLQGLENRSLSLGAPLYDALHERIAEIVDDADRPAAKAWFAAAELLSANGKRTLYKNVRDRLNSMSEIPALLELMRNGGSHLLDHGEFSARADDSVRHVLIPLLREDDGIVWLADNAPLLEEWVRNASQSTRGFLGEQVRDRATDSSETLRGLLNQLEQAWRISSAL